MRCIESLQPATLLSWSFRYSVSASRDSKIVFRNLGSVTLSDAWSAMREFTDARGPDTADEVWFVEHPPVFSLGLNADRRHVLDAGDIPVIEIDRGGQVTYHGPGQVIAYVLLDLKRRNWSVRRLVDEIEAVVVNTVGQYGVAARGRADARGVYVGDAKLAALGLKIRRQCSYHGFALNVAMDLEPFGRINPCGFENLPVTQLSEICSVASLDVVRNDLEREFSRRFAWSGGL